MLLRCFFPAIFFPPCSKQSAFEFFDFRHDTGSEAMSVNASFFLSSAQDQCTYNGSTIDATNLTLNGNLCAYVEGVSRVWACSAPDRVCWTYAQSCKGGDDTTPDRTQVGCSKDGVQWCCTREYDECTRTPGQTNVCWGLWRNPDFNMTASEALLYNQEHYSALPSTTSSSSSSSAAAAASSTTSANTAASSNAAATSGVASTGAAGDSGADGSLSLGAIAGIAVGSVVGGVALVAAAGFLFWRRRKRNAAPRWVHEADAREHVPPQELQNENQIVEVDGRPMLISGGSPAPKERPHELPDQRYQ